ncbi:MAG: OmpA family protein [Planctomycetota bacterium]
MSLPSSTSTRFALVGLAATATLASLGGCVDQVAYDKLYNQIDSLNNRNEVLTKERDQAKRDADALRAQAARDAAAMEELKKLNGDLVARLQAAGMSLADLEKRLGDINLQALDPTTDSLLSDLASKYPGLITYDPLRGMLRFNNDLTFDSGDDSVKSEGRSALSALAEILKNPAAAPYEVIIMGHTDAQKISANTARRHPTNVHLSAHRAISARRVLLEQGVEPGKMEVAGWGEFRPVVTNNANGNTAQNRRVEIFLTRLRSNADSGAIAPAGESPSPETTAAPSGGKTPVRPGDIVK